MKIEKHIPVPRQEKVSYPFKHMEIGDSVFFPNETTLSKAYISAKAYGNRYGVSFMGRTVDGGLRIWRTA